MDKEGSTHKSFKQKLVKAENNSDQQGQKKHKVEEKIDQALTSTQTALIDFG